MGIVLDEKSAKFFGALAWAMVRTGKDESADSFVTHFARAFKSPGQNVVDGKMVDIASTAESIAIEARKAGAI